MRSCFVPEKCNTLEDLGTANLYRHYSILILSQTSMHNVISEIFMFYFLAMQIYLRYCSTL